MQLEIFRGPHLHVVLEEARQALGDDAVILSTRRVREDGVELVEIVVVASTRLGALLRSLDQEERTPVPTRSGGQRVVALVGPTGSGKTTTAVKLAVHPAAFGTERVGFISLDTYRVAAVEQLGRYTEVMGAPLEVIYGQADLDAAMRRLTDCDVILVDTPGRDAHEQANGAAWGDSLAALKPEEVHIVIPAHMRPEAAMGFLEHYRCFNPTHLLVTKLDELPDESGATELSIRLGLPGRWVCDGQAVPEDLHPARPRLLRSLGLPDTTNGVEHVA